MPKENIRARIQQDRVPYDAWAKQGAVCLTEGNMVDYAYIRRDVLEWANNYHIKELAFDRWNATQLATELGNEGLTMVKFGQGFASMSAPSKYFEALVLAKRLAHGGHPVMRWMISHVAVQTDAAENMKPAKDKSSERIDGVVAAIMALGRATAGEVTNGPSVYETRGVIVL